MSWHAALARALVTIVLLASWNITTTHCAFAAAITPATPAVEQPDADGCPMHPTKKPAPEPQKKNDCPGLPCCKMLPATPAAKVVAVGKSAEKVAAEDYLSNGKAQLQLQCVKDRPAAVDTGPPRPNKLTEVIFQRSAPAHAPPAAS